MASRIKIPTGIEILESRIAPAALPLPGLPTINQAHWKAAVNGQSTGTGQSTFELHAGEGLSTSGDKSGTYLLFVEKGNCIVFATDLNFNGAVDYNEITGIAAGNGLRLISFVDIHGDIVTNLKETVITEPAAGGGTSTRLVLTLTDSDNNPTNDTEADGRYRGDGRVLLNNTIEKIELRSLLITDLPDQNNDGTVTQADVDLRQAVSSYSIFGNIYAGRGFGVPGDPTSGLFVDQAAAILPFGYPIHPMVNGIKVGTAASGEYYSFGVSSVNDFQGLIQRFVPQRGQAGAYIAGVHAATGTELNINYLIAGKGGVSAPGGTIQDVQLATDSIGGYVIVAGDGGDGPFGGAGGSILNFADSGSVTGKVLIKSGDGGTGSTGAGGSSGISTFGTLNLRGNVALELGDGGTGFTAGGNGASLAAGVITTPNPTGATGENAYGVTHLGDNTGGYVPRIGMQEAIDFNNDGVGDYVFSNNVRSQVVVSLGDGFGGFLPVPNPFGDLTDRAIFLPGFVNPDAMTVGDFNADGHPDIAVASSEHGQTGGVVVYLAKFEDVNNDGIVSGSENVIPDPVGDPQVDDFLGFYDGRFCALILPNPVQINKLAAGDFDGDGHAEIASEVTVITPTGPAQFVVFLDSDYEKGAPTGQFFINFGDLGDPTAVPPVQPTLKNPIIAITGGDDDIVEIQATALADENALIPDTYDKLIFMIRGANPGVAPGTIDYSVRTDPFGGPVPPMVIGNWTLGQLDTNRQLDNPATPNIENVALTIPSYNTLNFTVADFDDDGLADVAVLSLQPQNFVMVIVGDGTGNGTPDSVNPVNGDNNGLVVAANNEQALNITSGDYDGDGFANDFAVIAHDNPAPGEPVRLFHYLGGPGDGTNGASGAGAGATSSEVNTADVSIPFSTYILFTDDITTATVGTGQQAGTSISFGPPITSPNLLFPVLVADIGYQADSFTFQAGGGGDSLTGKGGNGGFLGSALSVMDVVDPITGAVTQTLLGALNFVIDAPVGLFAGNGGVGFSKGGAGGNISGVTIEQTQVPYLIPPPWPGSTLTAGNGGRGVSGPGGAGGSLFNNSIDEGEFFRAGDGGIGRIGGEGGSIIGNGHRGNFDSGASGHGNIPVAGLYDSATLSIVMIAGIGGDGTKRGGNGGGIRNFATALLDGALLSFTAGAGGNAVSGPGGTGGSIVDSSPLIGNFGSGDILLAAGNGGNGTSGGAGGNVVNFVDRLSAPFDFASIISVLGGHGGNAISGPGGRGGNVTGVDIPTYGTGFPILTPFAFDRIMGGNGGASSSGRGGDGGTVSNILTTAQQASYAVVAGAGGDGLLAGGTGGGISNVKIEVGGSPFANVLIAAGAGGNASAFIPNPNDLRPNQPLKAFGGRIGVGGNGGNITQVISESNSQAHYNLISGNGGDTITYGTPGDPKPFVGRGGSISVVRISGDIGNITPDSAVTPAINEAVPIKSYNNLLGGETFKEWTIAKLRPPVDPLFIVTLDDTDGNVGVVVGAAGRNKAAVSDPSNPTAFRSQPATFAKNGDLVDIVAKNLMSAVAGSVDRIAAINIAKGIRVEPGTIGAEKNLIGSTDPNYLDSNGVGTGTGEPVLEGRLVDGAVVAHTFLNLAGGVVTLPGKAFIR
jgi:hypothetical protein